MTTSLQPDSEKIEVSPHRVNGRGHRRRTGTEFDMEQDTSTEAARTAARVIARARGSYNNADAFDWQIKVEGIKPFGELYNEVYIIANERQPQARLCTSPAELEECKQRAAALWERVLPELERYADGCRAAQFTGWSKESSGPIRRVWDPS